MSAKVIFSSEDDKKLTELVGNHPCLYDLKQTSYKDQIVRSNVWKQISNELNRPVDECKKRWKNIKDTYNKKRRGRKLGTGSATKQKPSKWILEDILSFMDTAIYEKQSITNVTHEGDNIEEEYISSRDNSVSIQMESEIENVPSASTFEPITVVEKSEIDSTTKKRQKKTETLIEILSKRSEKINRLIQELIKTEGAEDSIDVFFKSMALTVKEFSPELKIRAKMEVLKIINELEFQNIKSLD